jgi:DNA-binding CsgD family transcriptional regulator
VQAAELLDDAASLYDAAGHGWEAEAARRTLVRETADNITLTRRELEVLRLVASGLSEREVADRLFISPHTAHRHLSNIRLKLGAATQAAAVAHAARMGLL